MVWSLADRVKNLIGKKWPGLLDSDMVTGGLITWYEKSSNLKIISDEKNSNLKIISDEKNSNLKKISNENIILDLKKFKFEKIAYSHPLQPVVHLQV